MQRIKKTIILTFVVMNLVFAIQVGYGVPETVKIQADVRLRQVALFKNGLGFFISEATCPAEKETFSVIPSAAACHGSFWVSYPPKVKLESLIAKETDADISVKAVTISEALQANVGKRVKLWLSDKNDTEIEGVIKYFAENREPFKPDPYAPGTGQTIIDDRRWNFTPSRLMIIETDAGETAINPESVRRVDFLNSKTEKTFTSKSKSMQLDVKMSGPAKGQKLVISYLAKGITWAPSYTVDITDPEKAQISAKAEIINEACDINNVTIQLVTGFPHLQFADVVSPLAKKENLAQFLQALARGASEQGALGSMSNVMTQQAIGYRRGAREDFAMPAYGAAQAGLTAEDLFFYPIEKVNLAKGCVGYFPLFTESVPYKHIYQWKIPDYVNEEDSYRYDQRQDQGQEREKVEEVWHCLRLENASKVPWTTAPAETVKESFILSQDTLNYTPVKGEATLRITQAVSVKAEQIEIETDRKRDAAQLYGYHYDLVTVEGRLSVTNFQQKAIDLEITKILSGEVKSSQPQAKIEKLARGLKRMNGVMNLTWTIKLGAGEHKQLDYTYEVYVRR